jgi:hypothetical protein
LTALGKNDTGQLSVVATKCLAPPSAGHSKSQRVAVITITGLGDHDQLEWLITMTGIRIRARPIRPLTPLDVPKQRER